MADLTTPTLERAELLLQEGNLREARLLLVELLKSSPASAPAWWAMSRAVVDEKQVLDCLERTLRFDPNHEQARIRLEQIKNPPLPVSDALIAGVSEEPLASNATLAEPSEEVAGTVAWEPPAAEMPGEQVSPALPSEEIPGRSSEPVLWEVPSLVESPPSADTPIPDHNFLTGGPTETKEELDLFAPGAFEKYNADRQEALTPSEAARPWVEELLQTLNAAEESEPVEKPVEEVPAWVVPARELSTLGAAELADEHKNGRMSPAEIVLLIILILLVLLVGGYFGLSLLGLI